MEAEEVAGRPGFKPSHPGAILREDVLPAMAEKGVTKVALAQALGIKRQSLYDLIREKRAVTPDMAVRLGRCLGNSPQFWLSLQANHDLWEAERDPEACKVRPIAA